MKLKSVKKFPQQPALPLTKKIPVLLLLIGSSALTVAQEITDLGTLGGRTSIAYGASADGAVIVGLSELTGNQNYHAFRYAGGAMTDLGTLGGGNSIAYGISADGQIIVGYSFIAGDSTYHAFRYANGVMGDIGTLGGNFSSASAISANGAVIVG